MTTDNSELKNKKKIVINHPKNISFSPSELLREGIQNGSDLKLLKEAMELQFTWEKHQAEKIYNRAIADFKSNPLEIIKESKVDFETQKGKVNYKYASLANVIEKITPELSKYGLTVSWRTQQNGKIIVTCRISHEMGHYEETTLSSDADNSGSKNAIQAMGSAITYMQRYTVLSLLGLACSDSDDDGRTSSANVEVVNKVQAQSLKERVRECAKAKFKTPDLFKEWRIYNNLAENLETATEMQLSSIWSALLGVKHAI